MLLTPSPNSDSVHFWSEVFSVSGEIPARISASEIKGEIGRNAGDIRDLHHFFLNAAKGSCFHLATHIDNYILPELSVSDWLQLA